ncbi:MAG: helix-turn-helix domain-containing protein, partial [Bosea sp. (in: a-proteobacteria)]
GRRCEGRRGNSRLKELVDLFMASPLVTVQMATDKLQVTPQAVEIMLKELGSSLPRELTGRKRYRAWGVI